MPDKLREQIFEKLFDTAEIAKFTPEQVRSYEDSLKYYRDLKNSLDTAKAEGKIEVAREMLKENEPIDKIIKFTGLTEESVEGLIKIPIYLYKCRIMHDKDGLHTHV